jgi:transcriptional regulator with PAS, ATPase and Fis domain
MTPQETQNIKQRFGIIGHSANLNQAIQVAVQIAPTEMTVLITGESGSGKESFSKIIHQLSPRKHNQFIAINCGAIPEGTIDSELFGHEKGSFTGANEARKGYFEVSNGGTIFLDEVAELPLGTQARLLRVLENGEYIKVGSSKVLKTDVRVVAATHVNLYDHVLNGKFREDLYYRLNSVPIFVPPLRERGQDIDLLFRKFASDFSEKYRVQPIKLTPDAIEVLLNFRFPGNIRQLKNLTDQISALELDRTITKEKLIKYLPDQKIPNHLPASSKTSASGDNFSERDILYKVLFDLKKDVVELKKLVFQSLSHETHGNEIIDRNAELFQDIEQNQDFNENRAKFLMPSKPTNYEPLDKTNRYHEEDEVQEIAHEEEIESLSIEQKEKELIIKALDKNKNKRKYAAKDLGISERTLYRKIKQYDIE